MRGGIFMQPQYKKNKSHDVRLQLPRVVAILVVSRGFDFERFNM